MDINKKIDEKEDQVKIGDMIEITSVGHVNKFSEIYFVCGAISEIVILSLDGISIWGTFNDTIEMNKSLKEDTISGHITSFRIFSKDKYELQIVSKQN